MPWQLWEQLLRPPVVDQGHEGIYFLGVSVLERRLGGVRPLGLEVDPGSVSESPSQQTMPAAY
jgi:hypothetical protein